MRKGKQILFRDGGSDGNKQEETPADVPGTTTEGGTENGGNETTGGEEKES